MEKFYSLLSYAEETEIYIHSQIGKTWYDESGIASGEFIQELKQIPKNHKINIHINSPGGSVTDGLAIYSELKQVADRLTITVDCLCASIASIILCASDNVIVNNASMIVIHKPWGGIEGNADELRKYADKLDMWEEKMLGIYQRKTGLSKDILAQMLRAETYIQPEEAMKLHFADEFIEDASEEKVAAFLKSDKIGYSKNVLHTYQIFAEKLKSKQLEKGNKKPMNEPNNAMELETLKAKMKELEEQNASLADAKNKLEAEKLKAKMDAIKAKVAEAVKDGRIANTDASIWENVLANNADGEKLLAGIKVPETNAKPEPFAVQEVSADVHYLAEHLKKLGGVERAAFRNNNKEKLIGYIKENPKASLSIDSALKQDLIIGYALDEFKMVTGPITKLFTTMFKNEPLKNSGTDTVLIPYYPLFTQTAKQFYYKGTSPNTTTNPEGYGAGGEFAVSKRSITVDKRLKIEFDWTSYDLNRTPFFELSKVMSKMSVCLAWQVWLLIHSEIKAANFQQKAFKNDIALANFNSDSVADVKLKCDNLQWVPGAGLRNMVINSIFENQLLKDTAIKNYAASSTNDPLFRGKLPPMFGFDIYTNPNIPDNGERLFGYACMPEALGIVNAPIRPDAHIPCEYEQATDPDTGMTLEARWWGSAKEDKAYCALEFNCGLGVLEEKALVRLVETSTSYNGRQ